jgi:hypothetical protein
MLFTDATAHAPGYRCLNCQSEERAIGPKFRRALELHIAHCLKKGHDVRPFGGLEKEAQ